MDFRRYSYLIAACGILALAVIIPLEFYFWFVAPKVEPLPGVQVLHPHFFGNPAVQLDKIRLKAVYVVPQGKTAWPDWKNIFEKALQDDAKFHALQFRNASQISFDIFSEPVFLENSAVYYDSNDTNGGNPRGLIAIAQELETRLLSPDGDLYSSEFVGKNPNEYTVLGILYEGVGAVGGTVYESGTSSSQKIIKSSKLPETIIANARIKDLNNLFLLNRKFLTDMPYNAYGSTLLYHEFAHTIGLPDAYDEHNAILSGDIMGGSRTEPISTTYIGDATLRMLGVLPEKYPR